MSFLFEHSGSEIGQDSGQELPKNTDAGARKALVRVLAAYGTPYQLCIWWTLWRERNQSCFGGQADSNSMVKFNCILLAYL